MLNHEDSFADEIDIEALDNFDKWILDSLDETVNEVNKYFDKYQFNEAIKKNKKPIMANFYKYSRKKLDILMDEGKPLGGKWSFDEENRKKLPKGVNVPKTNLDNNNKYTDKLSLLINKIFENNIGSTENNWLPADRKTALKFLDNFRKIDSNFLCYFVGGSKW